MLDFRYLKAFILTAKYQSFSKAGEDLKIAQSAVSRQIKLLEEAIGHELLLRSSKKLMLTEKGKELLNIATNFEQSALKIFDNEEIRPLKIGLLEGLLKNWFAPYLIQYSEKDKRQIIVTTTDVDLLKKGLETDKFDVVFGTENIQTDLISSLKLFEEKLVLINKGEINKTKLQDYRWIVFSENDHLFKISKTRNENYIMVNSLETIIQLVKAGLGIAIVPDHFVKKEDKLNSIALMNLPSAKIYLSTLSFKKMPERIQDLSNLIKK